MVLSRVQPVRQTAGVIVRDEKGQVVAGVVKSVEAGCAMVAEVVLALKEGPCLMSKRNLLV